jgi:hypothetical protein
VWLEYNGDTKSLSDGDSNESGDTLTVVYTINTSEFAGNNPDNYVVRADYNAPGDANCVDSSFGSIGSLAPNNPPPPEQPSPPDCTGNGCSDGDPGSQEPKDPCAGKTGASKDSCVAKNRCETEANRKQGKVFARAFNNACVTLPEFVQTLVNYVMMFAAIIAGFMFLQGGLKIIASRGNPAAIVEARSTLINAGVGLVLLATSYVLIHFLSNAFGYGVTTDINLLGPFVP